MARVCMSIENAPPEDWLMSKNREFTHQSTRFNEYKAQWAKSFPGKNSSLDSKLAWGHSIEFKYSYDNDELDLDEQSDPWRPQLESGSMRCVLGEILHQASDPTLQLQLLVARTSIPQLQFECPQKLFSSKAAKLSGAKGEGSIEEHKAWLQKQPAAEIPSSRESIKSADLVVLATLQVSRDDRVLEAVKQLLKDEMGLSLQEYGTVGGFDEYNIQNPLNQPPEGGDQFGGMAYFPSSQKKHADIVMLRVEFATGGDGVADEWQKEVEKAKETCQSNEETARDYLLVPRPDTPESSDEQEVVSGDTHYVLWLPKGYHELHSRVSGHLHRGAGEIEHIQSSIRLGCTSGGNKKLELVEREFNALKDVNDWPQKLCWLLALTRAISWDTYFLNDNEFPEEAAVILGKIATYWRTSILKRTGQELHLGLADDEASQVESREALLALLRTLKGHIEGSGCEWAPIKFGCVPGKPRKRSSKRPLAQIYANNVQA